MRKHARRLISTMRACAIFFFAVLCCCLHGSENETLAHKIVRTVTTIEIINFVGYFLAAALIFLTLCLAPRQSEYMEALREKDIVQYSALATTTSLGVDTAGVQRSRSLDMILYHGKTPCGADGTKKVKWYNTYDNNPVDTKLYSWNRWWRLQTKQAHVQGPGLFFCSSGFEQEFGQCRQEYSKVPGRKLGITKFDAENPLLPKP